MSHPTGGYRLPTGHKACSTSSPVHLGQNSSLLETNSAELPASFYTAHAMQAL
jgi:hypothetical protein